MFVITPRRWLHLKVWWSFNEHFASINIGKRSWVLIMKGMRWSRSNLLDCRHPLNLFKVLIQKHTHVVMYLDTRDSEMPKWTAKSKLHRLSFSFINVRRNWLTEPSFLWQWRLPPVIEMCNRRELMYLIVWLQWFTYACYHWFWRRCRGHTGRSSWCWWPAIKKRELKSCCCVPPMFLTFLGSLQVHCFFGDGNTYQVYVVGHFVH